MTTQRRGIFEVNINFEFGGVSLTQKALFAKHLALMLRAGLPISEALSISADSARSKLKSVLDKVRKSVEAGRPLSVSFAEFPSVFSNLFVNITRVGESSGTLPENLEGIADKLRKDREIIAKIRSAMMYPALVLIAAFVLGLMISFFVLPKITPLFAGLNVDLPITTKLLIKFSGIVEDKGIYLFSGTIVFFIFLFWLLRRRFTHPLTHWLYLRLPIVKGISGNSNLATFSRTLGTLIKSGVPIDEALEITTGSLGNYYYRRALGEVSKNTKKGIKLWKNLSEFENLFPPLLVKMIGVGEKSGNFEETLFYLADYYEQEVDNATRTLSTAIEPILLLSIGLVVGFLALSIITPIYDITGNISK